jgi:Sulfotransferase domain
MIRIDPNNPRGIIWLASYPKSGNTWLRIFLYHISRIMVGAPLEGNDLNLLDRSSVYEARLVDLYSQLLGKPVQTADWREVVPIRPRVHAEVAKRVPTPIFVKTHLALISVDGTPVINLGVTLGAIYVVRNPLDVVLSLSDHMGIPLEYAVETMCLDGYRVPHTEIEIYEPWGSWRENVGSWTSTGKDVILPIRYEDMQASPLRTFRGVMNHVRQQPTDAQIQEAIELSSFERLREIEKEAPFRERAPGTERFFRVGRSGQWHDKLSENQVRRLVSVNHRYMRRFGYLTQDLEKYVDDDAGLPASATG